MPYSEDNLIPISALQHYAFCPRQCALIHIECVWQENRFTAEGRVLHEKAHSSEGETRGNLRIARSVPLRSLEIGLTGIADVVEFHRHADDTETAFPVEYKRGKPKIGNCDRVQLCAQAICLEEMLRMAVPAGALFYGKTRRREDVLFDAALREETHGLAQAVHDLMIQGLTPPPEPNARCRSCSLATACMPDDAKRPAGTYVERCIRESCT